MRLRLGISTCPNDTFAFHAILERKVDLRGLELDVEILDIQELNEWLGAGSLDASKASFHAALHLAGRYGVLPVGAALGVGVGPLLLAARPDARLGTDSRVLCPGALTTATLLFQCLHPGIGVVEHRVFSDIMPALKRGEAEFGVVIHEGRFTYEKEGLRLIEDLGASWESTTGGPVPLGGILARLDLGADVHARLAAVIRGSVEYAHTHRDETLTTMRRYAQELDDAVIWAHVDTYVNAYTLDLGAEGRAALRELAARARAAGAIPADASDLCIID